MLRYLGHRGQSMDAVLQDLVEQCAVLCEREAVPRTVWRRLPVAADECAATLTGTGVLLEGADIARHLSGGEECIVMAATLGIGIDALVRRLQAVDLTRSVLVDSAASSLIEVVCDALETQLRADLAREGRGLSHRFSPGYGDLPLTVQPDLIRLLDAPRRIGLHCNEGDLLLPRKSVTALMAVLPSGACTGADESGQTKCATCNLRDSCAYRVAKPG